MVSIESDWVERINRLEEIVARLNGRMDSSEKDRVALHDQIESIKRDTSTLVTLMHAAAGLRNFLTWILPIIASALTAYVTWQVKK